MKQKRYKLCCFIAFIIMTIVLMNVCRTRKTHYLHLSFYDIETVSESAAIWSESMPFCMEIIGIQLKGYPGEIKFYDKQIINKVIEYLNSIPLVTTPAYFDKYSRTLVLKELSDLGYDFIKGSNERSASLRFYNDKGIEIGFVTIYNEKYLSDLNFHAYKVRDEDTLIISDLEALSF